MYTTKHQYLNHGCRVVGVSFHFITFRLDRLRKIKIKNDLLTFLGNIKIIGKVNIFISLKSLFVITLMT